MPVTRYVSIDGIVAHENRGGTVNTYRYDAWGSTSQMVDTSGNVTNSFEFDYFGNQIARTGTTATPFQWDCLKSTVAQPSSMYYLYQANLTYIATAASSTKVPFFNPGNTQGYQREPLPQVGPAPGGYRVTVEEYAMFSDCNWNSGKMFSAPHPRWRSVVCGADCITNHEKMHRKDHADCCRRFALCIKSHLKKKLNPQKCADAWGLYFNDSDWSECPANQYTLKCVESLYDKCCKNAGVIGMPRKQQEDCCKFLPRLIKAAKENVKKHCDKHGKPKHKRPECPFDAYGNIRKKK